MQAERVYVDLLWSDDIMSLTNFVKRLNPFVRIRKTKETNGIHSEGEFRDILEHERFRCDRNGNGFSLVTFAVQKARSSEQLLTVLFRRKVRVTDVVGWFDTQSIGVLLSDTFLKGAECFAHEICKMITDKASSLRYNIYLYPIDHTNHNGENRELRGNGSSDTRFKSDKGTSDRRTLFMKHAENESSMLPIQPSSNLLNDYSPSVQKLQKLFIRELPVWKRIVDINGAIIGIIIISPILLAVAFAIKLTTKDTIIFKQWRIGMGGKPFTFYKFRSMVIDAEERKKNLKQHNEREGPVFKMSNDPRITPVGRFIRKWSLDELPQLYNVLRGDMSLVGPRPPTPDEVPQYDNWHNRRLDIKPGITCIWQVYARHDKCFQKWVRMDIEYVRRQSLLFDLKILLKTLPAVFSRKGAC